MKRVLIILVNALVVFALVALVYASTNNHVTSALAARPPLPTPVVPTTPPGVWYLIDNHQNTCYEPNNPNGPPTNYYGIWINGNWKHSINVGASGLPAGSTQWNSYAPIAPGSSNGYGSLAYTAIQISQKLPFGVYHAKLWASDGFRSETVPITLTVKTVGTCAQY